MERFYEEVYDPIDFSCLLGVNKEGKGATNRDDGDQARSGYDHGRALQRRRALADFLKSVADVHPVYLASNSPKCHIIRAVNSLGLGDVDFAGMLSPDMNHATRSGSEDRSTPFPTKASPREYYKRIMERHPTESNRIVLLDDSLHNIRKAESVGIKGIHVNGSGRTLEEGLAQALGHILPSKSSDDAACGGYTFSDADYLLAKNRVDAQSINPFVWEQLAQELAMRVQQTDDGALRMADLGAGMLSMLRLIMEGGGKGDRTKPSMISLIKKHLSGQQGSIARLEYFAYESNLNLLEGCRERLFEMGFEETKNDSSDDVASFTNVVMKSEDKVEVTVHLRPTDYQSEQSPPRGLDLVIGCCFADLFNPSQLALSTRRFARRCRNPPLVYFPITFAGATQFVAAYPAMPSYSPGSRTMIPSDTTAFNLYSESLAAHGHNLDPSLIANAMRDHGGSLITKGASDWIIDRSTDRHLWETMLYFFGTSSAREMTRFGFDSEGWIRRCRDDPRTIVVSNVDLLFRLRRELEDKKVEGEGERDSTTVSAQEIRFVAPYNVTAVTRRWDKSDNPSRLSPNQVEIESICSLISSGTELKVFRGSFDDSSAALDENIEGMAEEKMEYPLAYGYSLVGRVVACGSDVDDAESLVGRLVFAFSPHSSRVIVGRDAIQVVPVGVSAEDAVFMPSVETALSLAHDAHVRMGENVAVYGQGLIGLLVTSILSMQSPPLFSPHGSFSTVTAFDVAPDRLRVAGALGATSALHPSEASSAGPFDVSIEVSGNPRALQSAIDHTSDNGRIIVGSWYGNSDVALRLGIDFHRSHKTIRTSQVSNIPCEATGLWSKERRFGLAWALVESIRPSRLITRRMTLDDAQRAYELLDEGKEVVVCFKYD